MSNTDETAVPGGLLSPATHRIHERARPSGDVYFVKHLGVVEGSESVGGSPAQVAGRRYERRVGQWLAARAAALKLEIWAHHWFEYQLGSEPFAAARRCQPDFLLIDNDELTVLVGECKQTYTDTDSQLDLYCRLMRAEELSPVPFTICKNLTPEVDRSRIVRRLEDVVAGSILVCRR